MRANLVLLPLFLVAGCSTASTDPALYAWRWEGLRKDDRAVRVQLEWISYSLEEKYLEPETHSRAARWWECKQATDSIFAAVLARIDPLRDGALRPARAQKFAGPTPTADWGRLACSQMPFSRREQDALQAFLAQALNRICTVEPLIKEEFVGNDERQGERLAALRARLQLPGPAFANSAEAGLSLQQLHNAWMHWQLDLAAFFNENSSRIQMCGIDYNFPFVMQNAEVLRRGSQLRIEAGVGRISSRSEPVVTVAGRSVAMNAEGLFVWTKKVAKKAGRHSVPVQISFCDQDGKQVTVTKIINYQIAPDVPDSLHD